MGERQRERRRRKEGGKDKERGRGGERHSGERSVVLVKTTAL